MMGKRNYTERYCECGKRLGIQNQCGLCASCRQKGERHWRWGGGRNVHPQGYILLRGYEDHPNAYSNGQIREHMLVMSQHLGRPLRPGEEVHHRNGVKDDNRIENLELWSKSQPAGTRVSDQIRWALEILDTYGSKAEDYE